MAVPAGVLAVGWIPFTVVSVLILLFAFIYIRYYQSHYDSEVSSSITAMLSLSVALFTTALVPVDIFLVSYMKYPNGTYKEWAEDPDDRHAIINTVLYAYYALYILQIVFMFVLLPFVYFYFEEKDDDVPNRARCCSALKFSIGFVVFVILLLTVGAFVPMGRVPSNGTEWDRIAYLFKELGSNNGEDAVSFTVSVLSLIGMLTLIVYTSYGMSALPMNLIRGVRSARKEQAEVQQRRDASRARIDAIRHKYRGRDRVGSRDRQTLQTLTDDEYVASRQEAELVQVRSSWLQKCCVLFRPFEIVLGVFLCLVTLLIFISLILTNVDKAMNSLGYKFGYALPNASLPNPIDLTLVFTQRVFPLDYIIMSGITLYFFFCTMAGVKNMGIWFLWLRLYKIRPRRTKPQGLLFMCMILMFVVLAINVVLYEIAPQYSVYGSQHYLANWTDVGNHSHHPTEHETRQCTTMAPPEECTMTRMTMLLTRYFYKVWFFGACYYWGSWLFLLVFVIGFFVAVFRRRTSSIDGRVDSSDIEDSDEELVTA